MSLKFGLGTSKKGGTSSTKSAAKKPSFAFENDESDEEQSTLGTASGTHSKKSKPTISQYGNLSSQKSFRKTVDKALEVDASIYDYDAAYDAIQAQNKARQEAEREKAQQGESKYMDNLLAAKSVREKDYLRAKEHKMQREREEEGDEFADKEKFVTGAYKRQQEELLRQEEEEKKREKAEKAKRDDGGQARFLKSILDQGERVHSEAVLAASSAEPGKPKNEEEAEKSESQIARELNEKGANIALTDDGEIADKRQLLSAGLNVMVKPKKSTSSNDSKPKQLPHLSQSNRPSNQKGSRERQTRMMEAQLEQMMKRQADEESEELRQKEHSSKSQKTSTDISSARERYLQRKQAAEATKSKNVAT